MAGTSGTPFSSAGGGTFRETQKKDPNSTAEYIKAVEKDLQNQVKNLKGAVDETTGKKVNKSLKGLAKLQKRNFAGLK